MITKVSCHRALMMVAVLTETSVQNYLSLSLSDRYFIKVVKNSAFFCVPMLGLVCKIKTSWNEVYNAIKLRLLQRQPLQLLSCKSTLKTRALQWVYYKNVSCFLLN